MFPSWSRAITLSQTVSSVVSPVGCSQAPCPTRVGDGKKLNVRAVYFRNWSNLAKPGLNRYETPSNEMLATPLWSGPSGSKAVARMKAESPAV